MKTISWLTFFILVLCSKAFSQHEHHHPRDTVKKIEADQDHSATPGVPMSHSYSLNLPMNRNGSGTGWLPDRSPMYGYMLHGPKWMYMIHGNIFIRYNNQDAGNEGTRGDTKVDAPNWFMAMGQRRIGERGLFHFNTMFSLDPIFGGNGYPLLFQTGETYNGKPLVDRQHPHNFFSELSIAYTHSFTKNVDTFVYFGYPGEPALGPVAFMHRPSSLNLPDSPLGHHWQDATHITFGVATVGFRYKIFKLDASVFTGREPGEKRYGFDKARFDSYSYRLSANPSKALSLQLSRGFVRSPESIAPQTDVVKTTASILHSLELRRKNQFITSALIWGHNDSGEDHKENSFTLESNLQLDQFALYGRYENIEKSAEELLLADVEHHELFSINSLTLGMNYTVFRLFATNLSIGAQGTIYRADNRLESVYGRTPVAFEVYLRISPHLMSLGSDR